MVGFQLTSYNWSLNKLCCCVCGILAWCIGLCIAGELRIVLGFLYFKPLIMFLGVTLQWSHRDGIAIYLRVVFRIHAFGVFAEQTFFTIQSDRREECNGVFGVFGVFAEQHDWSIRSVWCFRIDLKWCCNWCCRPFSLFHRSDRREANDEDAWLVCLQCFRRTAALNVAICQIVLSKLEM